MNKWIDIHARLEGQTKHIKLTGRTARRLATRSVGRIEGMRWKRGTFSKRYDATGLIDILVRGASRGPWVSMGTSASAAFRLIGHEIKFS